MFCPDGLCEIIGANLWAEKTMRRHSRASGNPKHISTNLDNTSFAKHRAMDSRLRGNDGILYYADF
uniref:Uncharacterized protein n=1 Tax=Conchiformibius kuhniae TaxID=211502 RepID=A0A8T9MU87_9NEIS|nr:hypothetical protein LVJ77_02780 [Conchiformibius kuhniae]